MCDVSPFFCNLMKSSVKISPHCFGAGFPCWGWYCLQEHWKHVGLVLLAIMTAGGWGHGHYWLGDQDHVTWWDVSCTRPIAPPLETLLWCEWIVMGNLKMFKILYLGWNWTKPKHTGTRGQKSSWHLGCTCIEDFDDIYNHHIMSLFISSFITALVYFLICHLLRNKLVF